MKEIPILFSSDMVKSLLAGRKTMTRRNTGLDEINEYPDKWKFLNMHSFSRQNIPCAQMQQIAGPFITNIKCPYGKKGDLLWVRESFRWVEGYIGSGAYDFKAEDNDFGSIKFKPSIHMPKEAARIWLEVVNIKVERTHDITEQDALNEGVLFYDDEVIGRRFKDYYSDASGYGHPDYDYPTVSTAVESFRLLWLKINGPESFKANPWVWVIEFKVLSTTGKQIQQLTENIIKE